MGSGIFYQNNLTPGDLMANAATGAASTATATITGAPGRQVMLCGVSITGVGATAAAVVSATTSGLINNLVFVIGVPAGVTTSITPVQASFWPPIPGNVGGNVSLSIPSFGAGNTNVAAFIWGFLQ